MDLTKSNTVGVIASADDMDRFIEVARQNPDQIDVIEIRVDLINHKDWDHIEVCLTMIRSTPDIKVQVIITVRDKSENGKEDGEGFSVNRRWALYSKFFRFADMIDIEVKMLDQLKDVISKAKELDIILIASLHDFDSMPVFDEIRHWITIAKLNGAGIFKLAVTVELSDFELLRVLFDKISGIHLSVMGMGEDNGKISRLFFAKAGSVLNYGHLGGEAVVPGQWYAPKLSGLITELKA